MKKILFVLAILITSMAYAQRPVYAPDFGITDSLGTTYYLYEDILEENKTAILVFFSVSCSSCYGAVPTINEWYNTYGQNEENLVIWSIEIADFSDDSAVYEFHQTYGSEYPLFNAQESDSVAELFDVNWTPFYFVICPDGSYRNYAIDVIPQAANACLEMVTVENEEIPLPELILDRGKIMLQGKTNQEYGLILYGVDGRPVYRALVHSGESTLMNLPKGLYLYQIIDAKGEFLTSGKFIF